MSGSVASLLRRWQHVAEIANRLTSASSITPGLPHPAYHFQLSCIVATGVGGFAGPGEAAGPRRRHHAGVQGQQDRRDAECALRPL